MSINDKTLNIKINKSDSFKLHKGISIFNVINSIDENEKENLNKESYNNFRRE